MVRHARGDTRLVCVAAGLLARASGQADRKRKQRDRWLDRAVALLRAALEKTPPGQRRAFWKENIRSDGALKPLWGHDGFKQLERKYAPPA